MHGHGVTGLGNHRGEWLVGLGVPMGTKVWRRRLRADPNGVSQ